MPQIGLCAKKTLHSRACHLSRCMPKSKHVLCIRAEGGSHKQFRESACQFCPLDSASVCTRTLMRRAVTHELHVFFVGETSSFSSAGREQHVPESSNHPLYLIRLFSFRNLEETPTQRHKHQHKDTNTNTTDTNTNTTDTNTNTTDTTTNTTHTRTNTYSPTHRPTDPPNTTFLPSLPSPSPSHTHTQTQMYMCICICRCVCVSVCVRINVNVSVSVYVSVRVYVYDLPQWFHVF